MDASSDFAKLIQPWKAQLIVGIRTFFFSVLKVAVLRVQIFINVTMQLNVSPCRTLLQGYLRFTDSVISG